MEGHEEALMAGHRMSELQSGPAAGESDAGHAQSHEVGVVTQHRTAQSSGQAGQRQVGLKETHGVRYAHSPEHL